jgi:hypothetical protein
MFRIRRGRVGVAIFLGLLIFIPIAQAEETFHVMGCSSGTFTMLSESKPLTVFNIVGKSIAWGALEEAFDNMTWNFVAVLRILDGNTVGMGYYKFTDTDGDFFVLEASGDTVMEGGTWKFLHGTGKWKGVTGQTKSKFIMRGKPVPLETEQYWCRIIGTIHLQE